MLTSTNSLYSGELLFDQRHVVRQTPLDRRGSVVVSTSAWHQAC